MRTFLLGIDIGTTGAKALIIDARGKVHASVLTEYPVSTPRPLWAEQNPDDWWRATIKSTRSALRESKVAASNIAGIGLTGQMHGLVLLDADGNVLRPCIMWNDQRTASECEFITKEVGRKRLLELTGNPVLPGFTAPKILWVRKHEPSTYSRVAKILLPKDYVRYRLTHSFLSDVSDASGTSLFDVGKRCWSKEMISHLEIPSAWLPDVTESPVASSTVSTSASKETGLIEGTPVVAGGGDQAAQAVGTGIIDEGTVSVTIGTSGVVFAASRHYRIEPQGRLHAFCHAVPGMWHLMGVMLSAGGSLRWYRDMLGDVEHRYSKEHRWNSYDLLLDPAAKIPAGSEGLLYLPYLSGERTPYPNPNARGVFFGLSLRHTKAHLTRAVLEGVAFALKDSLELMRPLEIIFNQVRASGGGARSTLWRQIMADIFGTTIITTNVTEGAAFGAALLAGAGTGVYENIAAACSTVIKSTQETHSGSDQRVYEAYYPLYRSLYSSLVSQFDEITALSTRSGIKGVNS